VTWALRQIMPILRILSVMSIVRGTRQFEAAHSFEWAKNADHSTDMESDGRFDSAK
jgi:hypothetical protein